NEDCHVILRGGREPNFDAASVDRACKELGASGLAVRVMIDLSHGNSRKDFKRQMEAGHDVAAQLAAGEDRVFGVMIESHIKEGRQDLVPGKPLDYGKSVTDACLGWEDSAALLGVLAQAVRDRRLALLDKE
ncbi:MAG: 3-deoxy-7-phosphoheptulonate synthase, partial [Burkholderiaceae bacterium]|nr:3-deoxy-7-phosphoheptulonate synthase [Burkholderiaceae bacterium]